MNVFLTGGSGDLGSALARQLEARGDRPVLFDLREPRVACGTFVEGSIIDRAALAAATSGADCVVHIAAWHGIHEKERTRRVLGFKRDRHVQRVRRGTERRREAVRVHLQHERDKPE